MTPVLFYFTDKSNLVKLKYELFGVSVTMLVMTIFLTSGLTNLPINLSYGLITGQNIGNAIVENGLIPGLTTTSKINPEINQSKDCYDETDCENKTGTENNIDIIDQPSVEDQQKIIPQKKEGQPEPISLLGKVYNVTGPIVSHNNGTPKTITCKPGDTILSGGFTKYLFDEGHTTVESYFVPVNNNSWTYLEGAGEANRISMTALCFDNP